MEACFLSSNAFNKTLEPVLSFKTRISTFPRRRLHHYKYGKVGQPFSIACCQLGPSSSPSPSPGEDEARISLDDDWRTFRARLVAGEQALKLASLEPSAVTNPDAVLDYHPPTIALGDKWVHKIHKPEKGCLLVATEELDGVHIFEKTVILVLSVSPIGATGIILNRPSLMSIKEMKSSSVLDVAGTFSDKPLFFGGPLEDGLFLVSSCNSKRERGNVDDSVGRSGVFEEVMKGLYYGTKESVGCAAEMVKRNVVGVGDFRFFDGYCAWGKEQLRDEIRGGYWRVAACGRRVIGLDSGNNSSGGVGLWEEVVGLLGPRKVW